MKKWGLPQNKIEIGGLMFKGKKLWSLGLVAILACLLVSLVLPACAPAAAPAASTPAATATPAKVYQWKMQSLSPKGSGDWGSNVLFADWMKRITKGQVIITPFGGGELVKAQDIVDGLKNNVIQVGHTFGGYYSGFMPEGAIDAGIPGTFTDPFQVLHVYNHLGVADIMRQAYADQGVFYMGACPYGTIPMWATKPVKTLADFQGLKVRATGLPADLLKSLGAAPTFIPHEESYTALQLGTIHGYSSGFSAYRDFKHWEIAHNIMLPGLLGQGVTGYGISQKALAELPADLQNIIKESAGNFMSLEYTTYSLEAEINIRNNASAWKAQFVQMDDEVIAAMQKFGFSTLDTYAAKNARCAKMVDIIKGFLKSSGAVK
jgi:TRAP-type mannitol/chloroaromatic compound transport system substrate-binding protein